MIIGIHLTALSNIKGGANFGMSVRSRIPKRLEANQRSEVIQWQSSKHWISPKRRETFCMVYQSAWCISDTNEISTAAGWKEQCEKVSIISRCATFCSRTRKKGTHCGNYTPRWTRQSVVVRTFCRKSNSEVVQILCGSQESMGLAKSQRDSRSGM